MTTSNPTVTFKHLVAGSVFHYQKRKANKDADNEPIKTLTFVGRKGGLGYYSTSDAGEIAELDRLAKDPQVQIEREDASIEEILATPEAAVMHKQQPPEIAQAVVEVQEQSAKAADPKLVAAQESLAKLIANAKS